MNKLALKYAKYKWKLDESKIKSAVFSYDPGFLYYPTATFEITLKNDEYRMIEIGMGEFFDFIGELL